LSDGLGQNDFFRCLADLKITRPSELNPGDPILTRIEGDKLFLKRSDGREMKTLIVNTERQTRFNNPAGAYVRYVMVPSYWLLRAFSLVAERLLIGGRRHVWLWNTLM
jgi:hypothetical protein